jgi:hypothetical protein
MKTIQTAAIYSPVISILLFTSVAWAISGGGSVGGGQGCGSCGVVPQVLQESASQLRKDFRSFERQELLDQQILGTICEKHNCGELTEEQSSLLLDRYFQEQDRISDEGEKSESRWLSRFGSALGAIGLLFSWLAYRQSKAAERQSVRNEVEIDHLKGN